MNKRRVITGIVVVAVLAALGAGWAISQGAGRPSVATAKATTGDLAVVVAASGTVEASASTAVYPPVAGTLREVRVTDGQAVNAGDVLATLDDAALRTAVAQAQAQVEQADAQAKAAKAAWASANAQRAAARALPTSTSAQRSARTAAIAAADAAAQAANAASDAAAAARAAASATLASARANADRATITAPTSGTVSFPVLAITSLDGSGPRAAAGASVTPASPVFTIVDLAKVSFAAQVDEADIAAVRPDAKASVTLDAYPGTTFEGTVSEIAARAVATKTGGTAFVVKVPLTPGDKVLRLGMTGDVALATQTVPGALVVPVQSVQSDGAARFVYKVVEGKVVKTAVTLGAATDTLAQVTSGLTDGDLVATGNLATLTDGATVNVQR